MLLFFDKHKRGLSMLLLLALLNSTVFPTTALALTSGPSQPEASDFTPVGTSDMVNLFSGDFNYNIPLLDVGGYPVNIAYNGGSFMDQEASWVGLGWNINAGAINRNMRGLPDDFNGDKVVKESNMKPNETYGVTLGLGAEQFGEGGAGAGVTSSFGITYNNYTGYGVSHSIGLAVTPVDGYPGTIGLGLSSSQDGLTVSPKLTFSCMLDQEGNETLKGSVSIGTSFNSRTGLKSLSIGGGFSSVTKKEKNGATKKYSSQGLSKNASFDFGAPTWVPQVSMPMHNRSYYFSFDLGGTITGIDVSGDISGSYSKQSLKYKTENIPAFGYMYQENGQDQDRVLMDFNREKDGAFSENAVLLPLTNNTYDLYSVAGQGVGGSYRLFRGDVGYVFDSKTSTDSESDALSGELGLGNVVKGAVNYYNTVVNQTSGKWSDQNIMKNKFRFKGKSKGSSYEPAYFKEAGEMAVDEDGMYAAMQENNAVRLAIDYGGFDSWTLPKFKLGDDATSNVPTSNTRAKRAKRNQLFTYLTKEEYQGAAVNKNLYSLIPAAVPGHHMAEITTTKTDGSRYVYGLPVFNTKQIERSFNSSGRPVVNSLVAIYPGDDSQNNSAGIDNFYTSTELPPYAYSYLITAVLSPDYVDVTGNGPTKDDLGNYTLFEYGTSNGVISSQGVMNYNWRTPYAPSANLASYDPGLRTDANDDKGSYVYGEKQITYLKQITTKNYIAIFNLKDRKDGIGTTGPTGGSGGAIQKLLESIQLFSKPDYDANGAGGAQIIKQVNFIYDYSLCPGVPNNNLSTAATCASCTELGNTGGKLTLKKIYFTYGKSQKARLSPYEFTYNTTAVNQSNVTFSPTYNMKAYDRWGTYKPELSSGTTNADYPYVEQNKTTADSYAALWNLSSITLPSGGKINIQLESDDYAYVQDKRATQMFKIIGSDYQIPSTLTGVTVPTNNYLYKLNGVNWDNYTVLYFKLNEPYPYSGSITNADINKFRAEYLEGVTDLYFRFSTNVNGSTVNSGYEYVSGYGTIWNSGIVSSSASPGQADYGWIQLKTVNRGDKDGNGLNQENPVSKAAWQYGRMHTPKAVFSANGQPANPGGGITDFMHAMLDASFFKNAIEFFLGMYGTMKVIKGYGKFFDTGKSWVKLNTPKKNRLGGGNRVKQITISDEWAGMIAANSNNATKTFQYGQTYDYTTSDPSTAYAISSGVASYEPAFGADENPCRRPIYNSGKKEELLLAPDNDLYQEGPIGESFFPSANVGYSKVTVKNLARTNVTKNGTGSVVNEFYTAKDFPVKVNEPTDLYMKRLKSNPLQKIFQMNFYDNITTSQGFCVELNDMHGKPMKTTVYDETGSQISRASYFYKQSGNELVNKTAVMDKAGNITQKNIGVDFDMVADFRQQESTTETIGIQGNLYFMMIGMFPLLVPPIIPSYHKESIRFRSAGVTKVVHHFGILEKTVAEDLGSKVETSNLLWDAETGNVLLSSTNTEFKDNLYNFNYPAYYAYSGMEPAYKNIRMEFDIATLANSTAGPGLGKVNSIYIPLLEPGDEFVVISNSTGLPIANSSNNVNDSKCWVSKKGTDYYLVDKNGVAIFSNAAISGTAYTLKLVRSGKRNQQAANMGNLVTFKSPVDLNQSSTSWPVLDGSKNVLAAGAIEYGNAWRTNCDCGLVPAGSVYNEYLKGTAGNWRQVKSYTYLTMRTQTKLSGNSNIRKDGVFEKFDPFWIPSGGASWSKPNNLATANSKWTWAQEVTEYSPYGAELENKDALQRYSAAMYGYNNSLPVAVGSNAKYRQLAFDGFEDYNYMPCASSGHFNFNTAGQAAYTYLSGNTNYQKFAHSGRKSIKVSPGQTPVKVVKDLAPCP